ncbi:MAG: TlpA disulfide reductase family protein [Pirellulales bacterium]
MRRFLTFTVLLGVSAMCSTVVVRAQEGATAPAQATPPAVKPLPDLTIAPTATRAELERLIDLAKQTQAQTPDQYRTLQITIRDGSNKLFSVINKADDPRSQQAELDSLSASAALMVNESVEARASVLDRMTKYLESRKELTLTDIKTAMLVGFYLELQPEKQPSHDLYALVDKLLKDDKREETASIRLTLQANMRRLELLGNKLAMNSTTLDGRKLKTDDFTGKFVLVPFFVAWSDPCLAELRHLQQVYDRYHGKGLEIVGVSMDAERSAAEKLKSDMKQPWSVIHDVSNPPDDVLSLKYGVISLPTTLLLNKEGTVVSLEAYGPELDRLMQQLFDQPTPADPPAGAGSPNASPDGSGKKTP